MYRILIKLKRFLKKFLKVKAETRQTVSTRTLSKIYKFVMLIMTVSLIAFLYPAENLFQPLDFPEKGEIAGKDIIAPFKITIYKTQKELEEERQTARESIPIIIDYDQETVTSILKRFDEFILAGSNARKIARTDEQESKSQQPERNKLIDSLKTQLQAEFPFVGAAAINRIFEIEDLRKSAEVIKDILQNEIYFSGLLHNVSELPNVTNKSVIIRMGKREAYLIRDKILDLTTAYESLLTSLNNRERADSIDADDCYELGRHFVVPNLYVNIDEMRARQMAAADDVSLDQEVVSVGDVIIRAGQKVTARHSEILAEMFRQKELLTEGESRTKYFMPVLARLILILAAFLILYIYLYHYHRQIYLSNPKILALFFIYAIELLFVYFIGIKLSLSIYLFPIAIFSILITVLFDSEIGMVNTFILALLLGILHRFNFSIVLTAVVTGIVASYSTQRVRHRAEFFKSILYLSITFIALIFILESFKVNPSENMLTLFGYGLINAFFSPLLAMGILPAFESLYGFTTDITLLELSDLNRPLLKRLALEAPGTYHHSILVGNLAEAAAKAINGNPLLARVGAYYHDIGKMEIPEYFVENQLGIKSKHDALTPTMSSIILSSHIKKGRVLGEEADLPDEILNFIEEHHGTMTMSYFYNKAKELGEENPSMDDYRYPGPKPQIRETAIVMLADSVEAASRTLSDAKPARLRNLVQNIINDRFQSGELEECPLTLRDLAQIRESFIQILIGVFHQRIEYPEKEEAK